ncbi:MAG TPA: glycosyltransferase family 4 protein [Solirubrobacteraceae bacterium]|nr:glycosyltransferase family 4 protein [Solirubrobacteraceae bacterium]
MNANPHAEVDRVDVGDDAIAFRGVLVGAEANAGELIARRRSDDHTVSAPAQLERTTFLAELPFAELPHSDRADYWDLFIRLADGTQLRLGRHLDDLENKAHAVVFGWRDIGGRRVRPFFGAGDHLYIRTSKPPADGRQREPDGHLPRRPVASLRDLVAHRVAAAAARALLRLRPSAPTRTGGRPKVTILIANAYGMGGTVRTCLNVAGHLTPRYDVELISIHRHVNEPFFAFPAGLKLRVVDDTRPRAVRNWRDRLRARLRNHPSVLVFPADFLLRRGCTLWTDLLLLRTLWGIREGVVMGTRPGLNLLALLLKRAGVSVVGQEHMNLATHTAQRQDEIARHYPQLDALTVLTSSDRETYEHVLADHPPLHEIPNAAPALEAPSSTLDRPVVLAAGRLTLQKGFDMLIPAFAQVVARHPEWTLRICGGGPQRHALAHQVVELGLSHNVFLMGPVDHLERQMAQASMFVLSSRHEGLPMVMVEAMSLGVPVVSFDCPTGPRDVIEDGRSGILVPADDVDALARAMLSVIEDPERRHELGAGAARRAQDYALESIGPRWEALIEELTA